MSATLVFEELDTHVATVDAAARRLRRVIAHSSHAVRCTKVIVYLLLAERAIRGMQASAPTSIADKEREELRELTERLIGTLRVLDDARGRFESGTLSVLERRVLRGIDRVHDEVEDLVEGLVIALDADARAALERAITSTYDRLRTTQHDVADWRERLAKL